MPSPAHRADLNDRPLAGVWTWWGDLSRIARLSLRREFTANLPLTALMGVMHLQFCSFVGRKALDMTDSQLQLFIAVIFLGFLLAGPLTGSLQRLRKMKVLTVALICIATILATIILIPSQPNSWRIYVFLFQILLAQIGMALVFTMRTAIWRANYPSQHRAKIVVLIELFLILGSSVVNIIYTISLDYLHLPFQSIYLISAAFALIAAWLFRRLRLRHEKSQLRSLIKNPVNKIKLFAGLAVLRSDKIFQKFMAWQMLNGFSTMLIDMGVLTILLVDVFQSSWTQGGAVLTAVPLIATGLSSLVWARFFDTSSIYTIRYFAALTWAFSRLILIIGILQHSLAVVLISRVFSGIAMGGGKLAWRLGHMEFAPPDQDSLYMGAHVTLTGLRGVLTPFVGIFLYQCECTYLHTSGILLITLSALGLITSAFGFRKMGAHLPANPPAPSTKSPSTPAQSP